MQDLQTETSLLLQIKEMQHLEGREVNQGNHQTMMNQGEVVRMTRKLKHWLTN